MASWEETLAQLAALSPLLQDLNISADSFAKCKRKPKKKANPFLQAIERSGNHSILEPNAGSILNIEENKNGEILEASSNQFQLPQPKRIFTDHSVLQLNSKPVVNILERARDRSILEPNSGSIFNIDDNKNTEFLEISSNRFQLPQPKRIFTDHSILQLNSDSEPIVKVLKYKNVEFGSEIFKKICARFPPSLCVLKIKEVQNPFLKKSFQLTQHFKYSDLQPLQLFHGTKSKYVESICTDNFNWRFTGIERGHKHGKGVNFTPKPLFAINFCDQAAGSTKVIILADVLVKNKCLGDENLVVPPQGYDTAMRKDSCVFVKFSDAEFYPAYIIFCKKKGEVK